jgi:hypothetical protein
MAAPNAQDGLEVGMVSVETRFLKRQSNSSCESGTVMKRSDGDEKLRMLSSREAELNLTSRMPTQTSQDK